MSSTSLRPEVLRDFRRFPRFPSVSTQPSHKKDVEACARWLRDHLRAIGLQANLYPTRGHPILVARFRPRKQHTPRAALIYGHYDVQLPELLELWKTPPFEPSIREGQVYARGSMDNKGQIFCHIKGLESLLRQNPDPPIEVIFLIEGEEEVGSRNLAPFDQKNDLDG